MSQNGKNQPNQWSAFVRNPDSVKIHIHPGARFKGGTELGDMSYLYLGGNVREVG